MESIINNLNESIYFVNSASNDTEKRNLLCNILTNDMIKLDEMERSNQRKNMIMAIQNVLSQLDNMFEKNKPLIRLQLNDDNRQSYLPHNKNSHYALYNTYSTNIHMNDL